MSDDIEVREFTMEELTPTKEERLRNLARMAIDRAQLQANNVPEQVANSVTTFRYMLNTPYSVQLFTVNGVPMACIVCEVEPGRVAVFAVLNDACTLQDESGIDLKDAYQHRDKRKMN